MYKRIIQPKYLDVFQTALVTKKDDIISYVKEKKTEFATKYSLKARAIPVLPEIVDYDKISSDLNTSHELIIGIDKETLKICKFDFDKNYITVISSLDIAIVDKFINSFINQVIARNDSNLIVINAEDTYIAEKNKEKYQYVNKQFNEVFESLSNYLKEQKDSYIKNDYNKDIFNNMSKTYCIIIGIDSFKTRLNDENKSRFNELFTSGKDLDIVNFIIVDSIDKINKLELELWYKNCVNNNFGLWIGNGINNQYSLKITQKIEEMKEEVPDNFCFVIKRGKPQYVKYIENFNANSNDDVEELSII